jgi:hypothetical protein
MRGLQKFLWGLQESLLKSESLKLFFIDPDCFLCDFLFLSLVSRQNKLSRTTPTYGTNIMLFRRLIYFYMVYYFSKILIQMLFLTLVLQINFVLKHVVVSYTRPSYKL